MDAAQLKVLDDATEDGKTARDYTQQMKAIWQYLKHGTYPDGYTKNQKRVIRKALEKGQYELEGGKLYYNTHVGKDIQHLNKRLLVVTAKEEKMRLFWHCHKSNLSAHLGLNATQAKLAMTHYWRGMKEDVRCYYKLCDVCQQPSKLAALAPAVKSVKDVGPWHVVGMDLIGPLKLTPRGNRYVLTLTDYFTMFVDFFAIPSKSVDAVAKALKTFFFRWGAPKKVLSDQEQEFITMLNDALADQKLKRMVTSANTPQTNGLNKKMNQTCKDRLGRLCNDQQDDWDQFLDEVAFSMRIQNHKSTKVTPFFLMFRREALMPHHMELHEEEEVKLEDPERQIKEEDIEVFVTKTEQDIKVC